MKYSRVQSTTGSELSPARGCTWIMLGNTVVGLRTCCGVEILSYYCAFNITLCVNKDYNTLLQIICVTKITVQLQQITFLLYNSTHNYSCWCFTHSRLKCFNQTPRSPRVQQFTFEININVIRWVTHRNTFMKYFLLDPRDFSLLWL